MTTLEVSEAEVWSLGSPVHLADRTVLHAFCPALRAGPTTRAHHMSHSCDRTQREQDDECKASCHAPPSETRGGAPDWRRPLLQIFVCRQCEAGIESCGTAWVAYQHLGPQVSGEAFLRRLPSFAAVRAPEHAAVGRDHEDIAEDRDCAGSRRPLGNRFADGAPALAWTIAA